MRLEVISRRPQGKARPTPLLFVHGAFGGAWLWDQHFLPWFAERGWEVHALSLRGHGGSEGRELLPMARLADYVDDVAQVAASLPAEPVLIGHSLGGVIVQKLLFQRKVPAAVLLASGPPHGMIGSFVNMLLFKPSLLWELTMAQMLGPQSADQDGAIRAALFSDATPQGAVRRYMPQFQAESMMVVLDLMGLDLPPSTPQLDMPVMVLGAGDDCFVFPGGVHATADTYRTRAEFFPGMAHAMMLEQDWEKVAARIDDWLKSTLGVAADASRLPQAASAGRDAPFAD